MTEQPKVEETQVQATEPVVETPAPEAVVETPAVVEAPVVETPAADAEPKDGDA